MRSRARTGKGLANPTRLAAFNDDRLTVVVIETPKGSRNKYAFDPEERIFQLKKVLPAGMAFPYDFGFVPSTKGGDGDPLDVLVLMDEPAFPGCKLTCRIVGVIEGKQRNEKKGKSERNDRVVAVESGNHSYAHIKKLSDLGDHFVQELEEFFINYHDLSEEQYHITGIKGPSAGRRCVKQAQSRAR